MKRNDKTGLSIFSRLLISFLGVVIAISGILTAVFYIFNRQAVEKTTTENIRQQFESIDYHLQFEMQEELLNDLRILAANPVLDEFMMSSAIEKEVNARALERLFLGSLKFIKGYESVTFVDAGGHEVVKVDRSGRIRHYRDISGNALFQRIREGGPGSIAFSSPARDRAGKAVFTIGINKTDADIGKFGGAVLVTYSLEAFLEYLNTIRIFDANPLWAFAPDGQVVKRPGDDTFRFDPRPYLSQEVQQEPKLRMLREGMLLYHDFTLVPGRPLLRLAICIPTNLLLKDTRSVLRFFSLVFILSLAIISLLAYVLSTYFSRPIIELARAATGLARGNLAIRVPEKASGEVRMLVESFNRMAEDLEKTTVSRNYVDDIFESMKDTLIILSPEGSITRVNVAACLLLGYDDRELLGQSFDRVLQQEPGAEVPSLVNVLKNNTISAVEKVYRARSGKAIPVLFSASVLRSADGGVQGCVCMAQDITERKIAEEKLKKYSEELQEINEELKNFTYIVSHDLRAPLINIKGFSEELICGIREIGPVLDKYLAEFPEEDRKKFNEVLKKDIPESLAFIGSSVSRMDKLINAILKLSRAGRHRQNPEPVCAADLISEVLKSLAHQVEVRNITVSVGDMPDLVADRTSLEQIFGNLLENAVKYLEPGRPGVITVSAERAGQEIVYRIRDNGRGMAKDDIPKAFDIFRRVGKQDVPGEGMGLAFVKTLVRSLGGRIWCESELGVGTLFSIALPDGLSAAGDANDMLVSPEAGKEQVT